MLTSLAPVSPHSRSPNTVALGSECATATISNQHRHDPFSPAARTRARTCLIKGASSVQIVGGGGVEKVVSGRRSLDAGCIIGSREGGRGARPSFSIRTEQEGQRKSCDQWSVAYRGACQVFSPWRGDGDALRFACNDGRVMINPLAASVGNAVSHWLAIRRERAKLGFLQHEFGIRMRTGVLGFIQHFPASNTSGRVDHSSTT